MFRRLLAIHLALLALAALLIITGCGGSGSSSGTGNDAASPDGNGPSGGSTDLAGGVFSVESADFSNGGDMPAALACQDEGGQNISPQLSWQKAPADTEVFALVMDDEDPPCGSGKDACRHWAVFNIPAGTTGLESGADLSGFAGVTQGENYQGQNGYAGPCPRERHTYQISVYALGEAMPDIPEGTAMTRGAFEERYGEFILAKATISGLYGP